MPPATAWRCGDCLHTNPIQTTKCTNCYERSTHPKEALITRTKHSSLRNPPTAPTPPARRPLLPPPTPSPSSPPTRALRSSVSTPNQAQPSSATHYSTLNATQAARKRKSTASDAAEDPSSRDPPTRPKRVCAEQKQGRVDRLFVAKKKPIQSPAPVKPAASLVTPGPSLPAPPPPPPAPARPPLPAAPAAVPVAPAPMPAPTAPAVAAVPYVPATRAETLALLHSLHSSLSLSSPPTSPSLLPSRSAQLTHITTFLRSALTSRTPHSLYIAGRPGVGKTLTVDLAVRSLLGGTGAAPGVYRSAGKGRSGTGLPATTVVAMNAMAVRESGGKFWPRLASMLRWCTRGNRAAYQPTDEDRAMTNDDGLRETQRLVRDRKERGEMVVLVVDEIDALFVSAPGSASMSGSAVPAGSAVLLRTLLDGIYAEDSCLVLLSISNNLRLLDEHQSSLSAARQMPERVVFSTYTHSDLLSILHERLSRTPTPSIPFFHPSALDLVTRSVSKDTGDIRRCLRDLRHVLQSLLDTPHTSPHDPAAYRVTAATLSRARATAAGSGGSGGRARELSHQQAGVLWLVAVKGGGRAGGLFECYKRTVRLARGLLAELSESELCCVVDVLDSVGMIKKSQGGTHRRPQRVDSAMTLDALRRELSADPWPLLWAKAEAVRQVPW